MKPIDLLHHEALVLKVKDHLDMRDTKTPTTRGRWKQQSVHDIHKYFHHSQPNLPSETYPCTGHSLLHLNTQEQYSATGTAYHHPPIWNLPSSWRQSPPGSAEMWPSPDPSDEAGWSIADALSGCISVPHTSKHIIEECTAHNTCLQHNIHSLRALWECLVQAMSFLRDSRLLGQTSWGTIMKQPKWYWEEMSSPFYFRDLSAEAFQQI